MNRQVNPIFDASAEQELMNFLNQHYGMEVFTPGLDRTKPLYAFAKKRLKALGTKIIIVAGTNGKGQTAHTLAHFFSQAGKSWALWTSPHILSVTERFLYSDKEGRPTSINASALLQTIKDHHTRLGEEHPGPKVSFYEFLFYVFLQLTLENPPEYLLLEVGLGGRLDAVNHFDADCSCITSISRDHQSILGGTYRSILLEKIAVSRPGKRLFTVFPLEYLNELTKTYCDEHEVLWTPLSFPGQHNYFSENQLLAWEIFLNFVPHFSEHKEKFFRTIPSFKGRREIMTFGKKSLIFIGAHNTDGIRRMLEAEKHRSSGQIDEVLVSFSKRPGDEIEVMLKSLMDFFADEAEIKVTSFVHPKAMDVEGLKKAIANVNKGMLEFVPDWNKHIQNAQAGSILICGSYYFIGEVQRSILSLPS